jgi:hypothetical protein
MFMKYVTVHEHWWSDTDNLKPKFSERNLPQCHFVHHGSLMDGLGIEQEGLRNARQASNLAWCKLLIRYNSNYPD